jgi:hypothetical protein
VVLYKSRLPYVLTADAPRKKEIYRHATKRMKDSTSSRADRSSQVETKTKVVIALIYAIENPYPCRDQTIKLTPAR